MKGLRSYDQSAISKLREPEGQERVKFTETTPEQAVAAVMKHAAETLDLSDADRRKLRWRWNGPPNGPQSSVEVFIAAPDDDETVIP